MKKRSSSVSRGGLYAIIGLVIAVIVLGGVLGYVASRKAVSPKTVTLPAKTVTKVTTKTLPPVTVTITKTTTKTTTSVKPTTTTTTKTTTTTTSTTTTKTTTTTTTKTTTSVKPTTTTTTKTTTKVVFSTLEPVVTTTYSAVAGTTIHFFLASFKPSSGSYAILYLGNGKTIKTTTQHVSYTYNYPGHYLVYYNIYKNGALTGSSMSNLIEITIAPKVPASIAPYVTVPTIVFNVTKNPTAPIFTVGEAAYFSGGFLQPPSGTNMTIYEYVWNFGNGKTLKVMANKTTHLPVTNPVSTTYSSPGLYSVSLTIITKNTYTGKTYNYTSYQTVAVKSSSYPFALYTPILKVPNPGTIVVAENVPGGPFSFDPDIDYESVGFEVISNIFATLIVYNGSSTTSFIPYVAEYLPTVGHGINSNYTEYTFKIRPGLYFSNGDPITAYDVWYSIIRDMLFSGGTPGTPGWILTQYLIPNYTPFTFPVKSPNDTKDFEAIMHAVTYNNATDTVTFHLYRPTAPQFLFTAVNDPLGAGILDAKWLEQVGAGIPNFTAAGFFAYEQEANEGNYNTKVQWDPVASGPYMIKSYTPGQSIVLVPNPYFKGVPGIPKPNDTVIIYWVKDPATAYEMFASGQADIVTGLPSSYVPLVEALEAKGQAAMYEFPTLSEFFWVFVVDVSQSGLKGINPSYHMPSYYFANPLVREAFAYAWNETEYLNDILGNAKYHFNFGTSYCGVIIPGLPYYLPPSEFTGCPTLNLTYAKQLMEKSGFYNISVYFPIIVPSGDTVDFTAAAMWAGLLHKMDPNINAQPLYLPFSTIIADEVPGKNPMPLYNLGWIADYPLASDFTDAMYLQGGTYPAPDGWTVSYFENLSKQFAAKGNTYLANLFANESKEYNELNTLITKADHAAIAGNNTAAQMYYKEATQIAINLYMYVYTVQSTAHWFIKPYMHGYMGKISYQENPMIGGAGDGLYYWWVKG
ncbi:MAG: ABC transporter substrate-binding protein [Caldisphaeraceae archaeon]|nr:ABC transporter substrate-binding protein [Caldisphaeraceae archaeon]MEB3798651.1 ABC transporter substrate-binding protein [Caldisphaeraceae archaeon]